MAHDVFISYSHKDKNVADAICSYFEKNGLRCWYAPRDIAPGADWAGSIIDAIRSTGVMVLIFTENSNMSQQVFREVSNAVSSGVTVVPFKLTEEPPVAGMQYFLSTVHWLDAMDKELGSSIEDLYDLVRIFVEKKQAKDAGFAGAAEDQAGIRERLSEAQERREQERLEKARKSKTKTGALIALAAVLIVALVILVIPKKGGGNDAGSGGGQEETAQSAESPEKSDSTGITSDTVSTDPTETYTQGNNQNNLNNGGWIATDGERYYYRSNDKQSMYSMAPDGSDRVKMTYEPVSCISILDGYIYYSTSSSDPAIKRMKPDGTDMSILHMGTTEDMRIVNGRIYYKDSGDQLYLYSMALDGSDVRRENTIRELYYFCLDGTYIYYANMDDNSMLYRAKIDGSEAECIFDHGVEHLGIAGNCLYFNDMTTNKFGSYDLSTGEVTENLNDYICYINVMEDGIYGYSGVNDTNLAFVQTDGYGLRILVPDRVRNVCVCGDLIIYLNDEDNMIYMVTRDGNNKVEA